MSSSRCDNLPHTAQTINQGVICLDENGDSVKTWLYSANSCWQNKLILDKYANQWSKRGATDPGLHSHLHS